MQIIKAEVTPVELKLERPVRLADQPEISAVTAIFVRLDLRSGQCAWGAAVAHPTFTGQPVAETVRVCRECAARVPDLHPTQIEYSLAALAPITTGSPAALCAFDLAFHDLLGIAAGIPLYRLLGGYRDRIMTSITISVMPEYESVIAAEAMAAEGFRILKIKGGEDPEGDVRRAHAIHRALPDLTLRLDADGGYSVRQALDVAHALEGIIESLEQPTPPKDLNALAEVAHRSPVPVLADQSSSDPASALQIAAGHCADAISVKLASCGGLRGARLMDGIARAAHIDVMVGCVVEPAMLTAAGLSYALSSPSVRYGDLDGFLHLEDDPSRPGFTLVEGRLIAGDAVGLGYSVDL